MVEKYRTMGWRAVTTCTSSTIGVCASPGSTPRLSFLNAMTQPIVRQFAPLLAAQYLLPNHEHFHEIQEYFLRKLVPRTLRCQIVLKHFIFLNL